MAILGDDWDELERKAAKGKKQCSNCMPVLIPSLTADQKRAEGGRKAGSDDSDDDRPKKKATSKPNGKNKGKR